ncbi:MAG: hypothetical protein PQJ58_07055, partial [Spirochaetales bacterium]|nr:hypothetical protein [Spirochaetales bacterium]
VLNVCCIAADAHSDELLCTPSGPAVVDFRVWGEDAAVTPVIQSLEGACSVESTNCVEEGCRDYSITLQDGRDIRKELSVLLNDRGFAIMQMKMKNPTLEDIFIDLTSSGRRNETLLESSADHPASQEAGS